MKYLIVGAGAMGCLYGAKLFQAGQEVAFVVSRREARDRINQEGICIEETGNRSTFLIPAYLAEEYQECADVIFLFTKAIHSKVALASVQHAIGENTLLVSVQNGIGNEKVMESYVDEDHRVIGTTNFPSDKLGDGKIAVKGSGVTRLNTVSGIQIPEFLSVVSHLKSAGLDPVVDPQIFAVIWEKAAFNAALNSLTAVTHLPQGYMGETEEGRELAHTIVHEVCMVAEAKEIPVKEEEVHRIVDNLLDHHFGHCPSMLQDVLQEKITEIECINGAVVYEANELGIETPVTKVLYQLVRIIQQTYPHRMVINKQIERGKS